MLRKKLSPLLLQPVFKTSHQNGFVMMIVIILIAAIISVVVISTSLSSISHLEGSQSVEESIRGEYSIEGCVSEALIQLKRDASYGGGTSNVGGVICTIGVSGVDNSRSIVISGLLGNYTQQWTLNVTLEPFVITSWVVN